MTERADVILGLDVGTTAAKASLFSLDGSVRITASREYPLLGPRPGWHVQEPAAVASGVLAAMRDAVAQIDHRARVRAGEARPGQRRLGVTDAAAAQPEHLIEVPEVPVAGLAPADRPTAIAAGRLRPARDFVDSAWASPGEGAPVDPLMRAPLRSRAVRLPCA